jgi:hypothetical protein
LIRYWGIAWIGLKLGEHEEMPSFSCHG